jgi:hypothetical protein
MKRLITTLAAAAIAALALATPAPAAALEYGLEKFDARFTNADSTPETPFDDPIATQAGSHPYSLTTQLVINNITLGTFEAIPSGQFKDVIVEQVAGFAGDTTAYPRCSTADFSTAIFAPEFGFASPQCPDDTAVGIAATSLLSPNYNIVEPIFNLEPPPGVLTRLGFSVINVRVAVDITVKPDGEYNVTAATYNVPQTINFFGSTLQIWGNPSDPVHDTTRGFCGNSFSFFEVRFEQFFGLDCPVTPKKTPFLTMPTSCRGPVPTSYETDAWAEPGKWATGSSLSHDNAEPPNPQGFTGCGKLQFEPSVTAEPTTKAADSPTGLDFNLNVHDEGLSSLEGLSQSNIKKVEVTLPEGMAANPSLAEGLGVCTEADLARETVNSEPGDGCPNASKIGTVEVDSPLIEEKVDGALYVAKPYENPFDSILALYIVIKNSKLGISIKQPLRVDRDPQTGQLTTVGEDLPQLPYSRFKLHFREGARSPLSSPSTCGTFEAKAKLYPWSGTEPVETTGPFQIVSGANGGSCPSGGLPSFRPHLDAGTINNAAGRFSPFYARLSRNDGEQEITHFSIKLPPGVIGKLAGVPFCSEAAIAKALSREEQPHGGQEEIDDPSCPAASQVGHTLVGAGVGPALTYAPGKIYLAGPFHGAPISLVAITSGVVGPFDIGAVVVRQALRVNPETGEVFVDATGSDPIPHIVEGFPVQLRDIQAYVDRPQFVLNPTNCEKTSTASTLLGSGLDFVSEADDNPITITSPFQAADCASLPFEPKLSLRLKGGSNRGAHPALIARLKMNGIGEAGISKTRVTLPRSEFIENSHFNTICTRVQFKAGAGNGAQCPAGSIYGHAVASTPILDEPLEGPVFLRSSERQLPDVVAALHGKEIDAVLVGHVDSVKGGGIRTTFEGIPDAPVNSAVFRFAGKSKGLFVNSTNLCKAKHRATVEFTGQNGKQRNFRPALQVKCAKKQGKSNRRHKRAVR